MAAAAQSRDSRFSFLSSIVIHLPDFQKNLHFLYCVFNQVGGYIELHQLMDIHVGNGYFRLVL